MTRPSKNIDRRLIEAGKALIPKTGVSGLSVRLVAKKAGVNLGMFNYHFKTKDRFIETLLFEVYEEFFKNLSVEAASGSNCKEQLENVLFQAGRYIRDNREIVFPFMEEIIRGNKHIMAYAKKNMTAHISLILRLVKECQRKGYIVKMSQLNVLPVFMGAVLAPVLVISVLNKFFQNGLLPGLLPMLLDKMALSDKALKQRIEIAFKGLAPCK